MKKLVVDLVVVLVLMSISCSQALEPVPETVTTPATVLPPTTTTDPSSVPSPSPGSAKLCYSLLAARL